MKKEKSVKVTYIVLRVLIVLALIMVFIPAVNPARIYDSINDNLALFTSGTSYSQLVDGLGRLIKKGWLPQASMKILFFSSLTMILGIASMSACACLSLGNLKCKRLGNRFAIAGALVILAGAGGVLASYLGIGGSVDLSKVNYVFPKGAIAFSIIAALILIVTLLASFSLPHPPIDMKYEMDSSYKLLLMFAPFFALVIVFSYLPLWGWRYAFFDYKPGDKLTLQNFVGFKWFAYLFRNKATVMDLARVMKNTLLMSLLGIAFSWLPMAFAIFLSEIKNNRFRKFIQTFTTVPNFISWVMVYAVALAIFSTDGFVSSILTNTGIWEEGKNMLMGADHIYLKMWAWGTWKSLGWNAIIYIAAISGLDQQLYEAAIVDGAGRFQRMWYITVPGLIPTYCVLLLLSIAGILNNGMDQYLVFENATNTNPIMVLDLFVYRLGIDQGLIPISTVIGMFKSVVSVVLLFVANRISKLIRKESII